MFWKIVNHQDAVQIKFEIAKGLSWFTYKNTKPLIDAKKQILKDIAEIDKNQELSK